MNERVNEMLTSRYKNVVRKRYSKYKTVRRMTAAVVQPRSDASLITFTLTITFIGNIDYVKIVDIWPISWSVRFFCISLYL